MILILSYATAFAGGCMLVGAIRSYDRGEKLGMVLKIIGGLGLGVIGTLLAWSTL